MGNFEPDLIFKPAPFIARFRPVLWEPLPGTGERVIALLAVEPHEASEQVVAPATHCIISETRLRQLLGRQRGGAAIGVLRQCAAFMTERQRAGLPLEDIRPLFRGFEVAPAMVARGHSAEQLLDSAVRNVSVFGSADEMIEEEEARTSSRHMPRTAEFLRAVRRIFVSADSNLAARFDVPLRLSNDLPEIVIDYANGQLMVQATSLPTTEKQAAYTEREYQAKLFQLEHVRKHVDGNPIRPALLLNIGALRDGASAEARRHANRTRDRLIGFASDSKAEIIEAANPDAAVQLLDELA